MSIPTLLVTADQLATGWIRFGGWKSHGLGARTIRTPMKIVDVLPNGVFRVVDEAAVIKAREEAEYQEMIDK